LLVPTTHLSFVLPWSTCQKCSAHKWDCMWQSCRAGTFIWFLRVFWPQHQTGWGERLLSETSPRLKLSAEMSCQPPEVDPPLGIYLPPALSWVSDQLPFQAWYNQLHN
jgi:hypothetical protein